MTLETHRARRYWMERAETGVGGGLAYDWQWDGRADTTAIMLMAGVTLTHP